MKGGTFEGVSELHQYNGIPASSSITGGTFSFDPTTYVDATCTVTNNNDGTWTVTPADSET